MKPLDEIINGLDTEALANLSRHLLSFVNSERAGRINRILDQRTRFLTVLLENILRPHNASAVIRSCECFGIQDLHVVESGHRFRASRNIVQGSAKWITLHRYRDANATQTCLENLTRSGYSIVAMSLEPGGFLSTNCLWTGPWHCASAPKSRV